MKIEYDREARAAYIELYEDAQVHSTVEITKTVFVDIDRYGLAVGVELLRPAESVSLARICAKVHVREDKQEELGRALQTVPMLSVQQNQLTPASTVESKDSQRPVEFS